MNVIDQFRLDGKTALVTGCRAGIGKAMAIGLAEAGANISSVSRTQEDKDSNIAKAIAPLKRDFKGYRCDFGNRDSLYEFIARIKVDFPLVKSAALLGIVFVHQLHLFGCDNCAARLICYESEDVNEGVKAFLEKRQPHFQGK